MEFIDPHWYQVRILAWTLLAFTYVAAAIRLQALEPEDYPIWIWGPLFAVGSGIFLLINSGHLFGGYPTVNTLLEYGVILALAIAGHAFYTLARRYIGLLEEIDDDTD